MPQDQPGSTSSRISGIAYTPAVKAAQERLGSRRVYAKMEARGEERPWQDTITPALAKFVAQRDSLYLGTASADGQPYVEHRGGPKGFLKVVDDHALALAEFPGNAQYISIGNLSENSKAFMFLMDYPRVYRESGKFGRPAGTCAPSRGLGSRTTTAQNVQLATPPGRPAQATPEQFGDRVGFPQAYY